MLERRLDKLDLKKARKARKDPTRTVVRMNKVQRIQHIFLLTSFFALVITGIVLGNGTDTSHIIGFGTLDERMRILMDVERLVGGADLGSIGKVH